MYCLSLLQYGKDQHDHCEIVDQKYMRGLRRPGIIQIVIQRYESASTANCVVFSDVYSLTTQPSLHCSAPRNQSTYHYDFNLLTTA